MAVHIIEDDFAVCDALTLFLQELGHYVLAYEDAETFFKAGLPKREDTVIVDVGLPGVDGRSVINWLQGMAAPPRIIAISGKPKVLLEDSIRGLSGIVVLRKPLSLSELSEHFGHVPLRRSPALEARV
ncbi:hypothetical protein GCM10011316_21150 [Roseibium aquae]|uniref:Response regulatory domain-containing protein n=1 Tax=Roseibium aquae TaxID=1323746 RepID=A0A916TKF7_9HYPH|nr:response regulator [Roseibium aquae]GGB48789.1 hypothetical protein GCM10011316_21150 [Roseibium aquae]